MIIPIRRSPTWPLRLSNAELGAEFERTYDERGPREPPALLRRLDILHDEIRRRERIGTWTDDDWKQRPSDVASVRPPFIREEARTGHLASKRPRPPNVRRGQRRGRRGRCSKISPGCSAGQSRTSSRRTFPIVGYRQWMTERTARSRLWAQLSQNRTSSSRETVSAVDLLAREIG